MSTGPPTVFWSGSAPDPQTPTSGGVRRHRRAGTALVVAVVLVCTAALGAHLTRYVGLVEGPLAGPARSTAHQPGLAIPASCRRLDNPATGATFPSGDGFSHDLTEYGDGSQLQRLYAVTTTTHTLTPVDGLGAVRDCDAALWALVTAVAPGRVLDDLKEFMVFDSADSTKDSVVVGEVSAHGDTDASAWRLAIAPNGLDTVDLTIDIAHEVGHLRSLDSSQLDPTVADPDRCPTIWTGQGCLLESSSLATFFQDTWSDSEVNAWDTAYAIDDDTAREKALEDFYDAHPQDFVTDYAATAPEEDYAESFAYWCVFGPDNPRQGDYMPGNPTDGAAKLAWVADSSHGLSAEFADGCGRLRALTH